MAFVREREKNGNTYYELVESVRDGDRVRQEFVEYLGDETLAREFCRSREDIEFPGSERRSLDREIEEKKQEMDSLRPIPEEKQRKLEDEIELNWIYNSNTIEGNTLTKKQTERRLDNDENIKGKSIEDQREVDNHELAIQLCKKYAESEDDITEDMIKRIQGTLTAGVLEESFVGEYRDIEVKIRGKPELDLANPVVIDERMEELTDYINENPDGLSPVELSAEAHVRLVRIHPFADGNGRTARILTNLILMRNGYPPIVIRENERSRYIKSLNRDHLDDEKVFFRTFIKKHVRDALESRIQAAREG